MIYLEIVFISFLKNFTGENKLMNTKHINQITAGINAIDAAITYKSIATGIPINNRPTNGIALDNDIIPLAGIDIYENGNATPTPIIKPVTP